MVKYSDRQIDESLGIKLLEPIVNQKTKVLIQCSCGTTYRIKPQALFRENRVTKCKSCSSKDRIKGYAIDGGLRKHKAYGILDGMKQRCYNENNPKYEFYGGIGISICKEWMNSYLSFCIWADNNGFKEGLTIDRIDVNGNYEPNNCRWIPFEQQKENKHIQRNNSSGYCGVSFQKNYNKWYSYININGKRINCGYYQTREEASIARETRIKELNLNYTREKYE